MISMSNYSKITETQDIAVSLLKISAKLLILHGLDYFTSHKQYFMDNIKLNNHLFLRFKILLKLLL